jgi:branched-chain amino acid transport system permease protein
MEAFGSYIVYLLVLLGVNIILASSLNMINGYCGLFSLGHAGFFAVGAYASAVATKMWIPEWVEAAPVLALLVGCGVGVLAAALAGFVVGVPCLRLTGDYLAIATVGFGEIIRIVLLNMDSVGGSRGFTDVPKLTNVFYVGVAAAIVLWLIGNLMKSSFGRCILATREDEIAARSMGVDVRFFKTFAFVVGSAFAGLAGALFAHNQQFLHPNNFQFMISIQILLMIVIGGIGSQTGAVLGAVIVTLIPQMLRFHPALAEQQVLVFGVIMVLVMLLKPDGLMSLLRRGPKELKS